MVHYQLPTLRLSAPGWIRTSGQETLHSEDVLDKHQLAVEADCGPRIRDRIEKAAKRLRMKLPKTST